MTTTAPVTLPRPLRFGLRWITSMTSYALFGLGGLVLGMVIFPLVTLTSLDASVRVARRRDLLQAAFRGYIRLLAAVGAASYEVRGAPATDRNYLIVANHPTLLDAVYLLALFPQADCVIKHGLLRNPFTRFALSGLDYVDNADTADMLDAVVARLEAGRSVLVFPEGTRSRPGEPLKFHLAAATMAVRAGVPCQPVVITCEPVTVAKGTPWYQIAPHRPHFRVHIEAPVSIEAIVGGLSPRYAKRALNAFLQGYYNRRLLNFRPAPASGHAPRERRSTSV